MVGAPVVAGVGSRSITDEERDTIARTSRWLARRGFRLRSGGARGSDTVWAEAFARIAPERLTVCLPDGQGRALWTDVPDGALPEIPPYPGWMVAMARAEFTFRERTPELGFPPYDEAAVAAAYRERASWRGVRRKAQQKADGWIAPDDAYVQRLMIRNVAILFEGWRFGRGREVARTVDVVLGLLGEERGGGGTGHTFRLAETLGIPAFNLRDPDQAREARTALHGLARRDPTPGTDRGGR